VSDLQRWIFLDETNNRTPPMLKIIHHKNANQLLLPPANQFQSTAMIGGADLHLQE